MSTDEFQYLHGQNTPRCTATVDKRFEGYFTVQYLTAGGVELFYEQNRYEIFEPTFWPASPGPRIRFHPHPKIGWWEHRHVAFKGRLVQKWIKAGLYFPSTVQTGVVTAGTPGAKVGFKPQIAPRGRQHGIGFDRMVSLFHTGGRWNTLRGINLLEGLLLELAAAREARPIEMREPWITKVCERISDHAWDGNDESLAREMGMGLSTLRRRFTRAVGSPMNKFVIGVRLAEARRLLVETDEPIKSIATRLGYGDVYFFSRQFREKVGVPPGEFRKGRQ